MLVWCFGSLLGEIWNWLSYREGKERPEKGQRLQKVGGRFNKQGSYIHGFLGHRQEKWISWIACQNLRSLQRGPTWVQSDHPTQTVSASPSSQGCIPETAPTMGTVDRIHILRTGNQGRGFHCLGLALGSTRGHVLSVISSSSWYYNETKYVTA